MGDVHTHPWNLGANVLKKVLKHRGLDSTTTGLKGNDAKRALGDRLQAYLVPAPKKDEASGGGSAGSSASSSSTSDSASGAAAAPAPGDVRKDRPEHSTLDASTQAVKKAKASGE